jgi:hypothetical protein
VVDFEKINARKEELTRLKCSKIWQNKREIYLSKTEDKKNNHINQILFQSGTGIDDHELIENEDDFLITFFPVIIVSQNVMEKYKNLLAAKTDIIFFANITDYKDKLELSIPEQFDGKMVFFTEDKEYEDHLKKVLWKLSYQKKLVHVELNGYHQQGMIELLDMNNTERLYAARNLAYMMQTSNNNIKLFHIKNKIIFSALDDVLNKIMVKLLESHGIKEMKIIDTPFHLLVDSILEINNKQVLLIQNHLINYKNAENLKWQLFVLEKVRKSGIRVINFNTTELLNESVKSIREFISGI